jgi:hypothetical protein
MSRKSRCPRRLPSYAAGHRGARDGIGVPRGARHGVLGGLLLQKSLEASLVAPDVLMTDFAKFDRPDVLHLGYQVGPAPALGLLCLCCL